MIQLHAHPAAAGAGGAASRPPAGGWDAQGDAACYCPTRMLASFALLMAGHGRCVNTCMMLGDREYAMWQLELARGMDDAELDAVTERLTAFFDDARDTAASVLGTA